MDDLKAEVQKAVEGAAAAPSPAQTPAASPEVKTEVKPEATPAAPAAPVAPKEPEKVDAVKLQEQVANLNKALQMERDAGRGYSEKVAALEKQLAGTNETLTNLKNVFAPPAPAVPPQPSYMTKEEIDAEFRRRETALTEQQKAKEAETILKAEVVTLEKEWDGKDDKPKYDDQEILRWQQENNKLYLSPSEAFAIAKRNEIIDWETKQRLAGKKEVKTVERPGGAPMEHNPSENLPKNDQELKSAVAEAIKIAAGGE